MAVTNVTASFPDVILPPGATITITLDDALADITKLNVFTYSRAKSDTEDVPVLPPVLAFGAEPV